MSNLIMILLLSLINYYTSIFILGDSTVGKSAMTQVFHSDGSTFPKNYQMVCINFQRGARIAK